MPVHRAPLSIIDQTKRYRPYVPDWTSWPATGPFLAGKIVDDEKQHERMVEWSDENPRIAFEEVVATGLPSYDSLKEKNMPIHLLDTDFRATPARSDSGAVVIASYCKIDGGVIVGIAPLHAFMDCGAFQMLVELWARYTSGAQPHIQPEPMAPIRRKEMINSAILATRVQNTKAVKKQNDPSMVPEVLPCQVIPIVFKFSVAKLDKLRSSIARSAEAKASLNTLVGSLLWHVLACVRLKRFRTNNSSLNPSELFSEAKWPVDCHKLFEESCSLEDATSYLGNRVGVVQPSVSYGELAAPGEVQLDLDQTCPEAVISSIRKGTEGMAARNLSDLIGHFADLIDASSSPSFDFAKIRRVSNASDNVNCSVTCWSSFDFYLDFGPVAGKPEFVRTAGGPLEGAVIVLPRKRNTQLYTLEERDDLDVMMMTREDDQVQVQKHPLLMSLLKEEPVMGLPRSQVSV